jgi:hypothetical protein
MPLAKLHVLEGRYDEARLGKVSSAVQNGLISGLGHPAGGLLPDHSRSAEEPIPSYAIILGVELFG